MSRRSEDKCVADRQTSLVAVLRTMSALLTRRPACREGRCAIRRCGGGNQAGASRSSEPGPPPVRQPGRPSAPRCPRDVEHRREPGVHAHLGETFPDEVLEVVHRGLAWLDVRGAFISAGGPTGTLNSPTMPERRVVTIPVHPAASTSSGRQPTARPRRRGPGYWPASRRTAARGTRRSRRSR